MEGEPRKLVEDLDDYERMWSRLKETYDNPTKMIDSILGGIRATKLVMEGDNKKLISTINTVKKICLDFKNLSQSHELEETTVLACVDKLLPIT